MDAKSLTVLMQFAGSVINTVTWYSALKSKLWVRFPLCVSEVCVLITDSATFSAGRLPLKYHQNAGKIHVKIQFRGVRCSKLFYQLSLANEPCMVSKPKGEQGLRGSVLLS